MVFYSLPPPSREKDSFIDLVNSFDDCAGCHSKGRGWRNHGSDGELLKEDEG